MYLKLKTIFASVVIQSLKVLSNVQASAVGDLCEDGLYEVTKLFTLDTMSMVVAYIGSSSLYQSWSCCRKAFVL
uniref:Uncharacterized protein n=1 Tax=Physcomitrium patens TaxID=3218 RepID=A0A2K1L030_PHYPA|nr:hypothetical protein PHYPA_002175 [Physcomitrium patens]